MWIFFSCQLNVFSKICYSSFFILLLSDLWSTDIRRRRYDISMAQSCRISEHNHLGNAFMSELHTACDCHWINLFFVIKINPSNKNKNSARRSSFRCTCGIFEKCNRYNCWFRLKTKDCQLKTEDWKRINLFECYRRLDHAIVYICTYKCRKLSRKSYY